MDYPDTALLAAVEATRLEESPEDAYGALLTLLARQPQVVHRVRTDNKFLRIAANPTRTVLCHRELRPVHPRDRRETA